MDRREAVESIIPLGWLLSAKDAGSLDPRQWNQAGQLGLVKDGLLFLPGCSGKIFGPEKNPDKKLSLKIVSESGQSEVEVFFASPRIADINENPLASMISLLAEQKGTLPKKISLFLQEEELKNEPNTLARTLDKSNEIYVYLGALFSRPEDFLLDGYTPEALAQGVTASGIFQLMFSECQCLPIEMPVTDENIGRMGISFGFMVAAIYSQRSFEQYVSDSQQMLWKEKPLYYFDQQSFQKFQKALEQPFLVFAKE